MTAIEEKEQGQNESEYEHHDNRETFSLRAFSEMTDTKSTSIIPQAIEEKEQGQNESEHEQHNNRETFSLRAFSEMTDTKSTSIIPQVFIAPNERINQMMSLNSR
jgi:predicted component of type VI protein secretion system